MVERRLGRGLDFFLTEAKQPQAAEAGKPSADAVTQIDVEKLRPNPEQPRRDFRDAEVLELAESIRSTGMLQPILARQQGETYQIIAGERRWRAAKSIGLERVPVIVRDVPEDQVAIFAVVENLHRADLNPVEKARGFRRIQELAKCGTEEVARKVGLDRSTVANFIRLLELPAEVLGHVSRGTITMGHARALLGLPGSDAQKEVAGEIIRRKLSVRQVEELVQSLRESGAKPAVDDRGAPKKRQPKAEAWVRECETSLQDSLGAEVTVRYGKRKSRIVIDVNGREEFERVYAKLRGDA
ncbi:MAG: ParB/RepB/Spo0J family partition protein [Planctomycetes bacterium]|nr:ParB/RepB/Spo0J family partition protein [Planctomycetota bacterium]